MEGIAMQDTTKRKKTIDEKYRGLPDYIRGVIQVLSFFIGLIFPVALFVPFVLLLAFTAIRIKVLGRPVYYYRKTDHGWNWGDIYTRKVNQKRFDLNVSWNYNSPQWGLEFTGDGEYGREILLSYWLFGFCFFISVHGYFPKHWYPKYYMSNGKLTYRGIREYEFSLHDQMSWLAIHYDHSGYSRDNGLNIAWDPIEMVIGYTKCTYEYYNDFKQYVIPMAEGSYNLVIIKMDQIRKPKRWKAKSIPLFEIIPGQIIPWDGMPIEYGSFVFIEDQDGAYNGQLEKYLKVIKINDWYSYKGPRPDFVIKQIPVPIPGKGENSWDCDEDRMFSMSTGISKTYQEAALSFMDSCLRTRWKYGGTHWLPEKFSGLDVNMITNTLK